MSPEAVKRPDQVDARSDLYSLGAVGFFLVTGGPPFEADTLAALIEAQTTTLPPNFSEILQTPVSVEFETVILQCLAKDQAARPPSALALEEALAARATATGWNVTQATKWWLAKAPTKSSTPALFQERTLVVEAPSQTSRELHA